MLTIANGLAGTASVLCLLDGNMTWASYSIFLGAIFDFLDGFTARLLKVTSPVGKMLDSLSDMITFGVAPAAIAYVLIKSNAKSCYHVVAPFFLVACSALRLAKFSVDTRQDTVFIGLPTPVCALVVALLPVVIRTSHSIYIYRLTNPWILTCFIILLSSLLVSPIPFLALKFKSFDWRSNRYKYLFLLCALLLCAFFRADGLLALLMTYIWGCLLLYTFL